MYIYVYICIYTYVYICIYTYIYMLRPRLLARALGGHIHIEIQTYIYVYNIHIHIYANTYTFIYTYIYTYICVHIYVYIYMCIYVYICAFVCVCVCVRACACVCVHVCIGDDSFYHFMLATCDTTHRRLRLVYVCQDSSIYTTWPLYGGKVAGLIWIRFAAEALRFSFAKSLRPPLKMWKCKVKVTIISRFKLFQVFATPKSGIHGPLAEVVHGNRGALTSTKSLNVC